LTTFFVDTSALARRYLAEVGSAWTLSWIEPPAGNVIIISELARVELISTLTRLQREGKLAATNALKLHNDFLLHTVAEYLVVPVESNVFQQAVGLVQKYPLRTLDALQLACALKAVTLLNEPLTFVCGDNRLLNAAALEGFSTDNPYLHP
jgi:predicted nucleic acid-binding protein